MKKITKSSVDEPTKIRKTRLPSKSLECYCNTETPCLWRFGDSNFYQRILNL